MACAHNTSPAPLYCGMGRTPLQRPRYKLDIDLNYVPETCQRPTDYYDKCNSAPCTRCTPEQKCTEPTKRKIDPTKCVPKKHYYPEPSLYGFEGDPWYGWSTIGQERSKNEEGPYSMVTMQPYGYPNASVIVLLNDTEPHNFTPPTALSGLERLNKFPNQRGVLLPDCPARETQKECDTIGCPTFITPGTFNPATGRYTPKKYFPPHFHDMHSFLEKKAYETGAKDLGYTYETCFKYPEGVDVEGYKERDVFGFCQEGPCGHPQKYKDIGKCQYVDCPAKTVCVEKEPETEDEDEHFSLEGEEDDTDVRPGQVVIEHGISRQVCCFEDSVSSFSDSLDDESFQSGSITSDRLSAKEGKGQRRISWDEELGERESEESIKRHFKTMLFGIDIESKRKRDKREDEFVPHRRCTWKCETGTMHDIDDEARHVSSHILNELLSRGSAVKHSTARPKQTDSRESRNISKGIIEGILGLGSPETNDFESHELAPAPKSTIKYSKYTRDSGDKKPGSRGGGSRRPGSRGSGRRTRVSKKRSRTSRDSNRSGSESGDDKRKRSRDSQRRSDGIKRSADHGHNSERSRSAQSTTSIRSKDSRTQSRSKSRKGSGKSSKTKHKLTNIIKII